jgi:molybdopterin synthase catalytic subunit
VPRLSRHSGVYEKARITLPALLESIKSNPNFAKAGAVGVFVGVVRGETIEKNMVQKLELEAYAEKANEVLAEICSELKERDGVVDVQIHHLIGEFGVGEDVVYVIVAGVHRHDVFPVLEEAVERYKKEAPIFKKEYIIDKEETPRSYWVSERKTR